ncbi:MAG TPA: hypothetical protein VFJ51_13290 [Nitrososphaeraceae archaeon]|nr:hypothetical protein [Nitrososphaeraceae archaeon]
MLKDNDIQIKFEEPYENTRKHSKFNLGEDLVVVPVEIEADSTLYNFLERYKVTLTWSWNAIPRMGQHLL